MNHQENKVEAASCRLVCHILSGWKPLLPYKFVSSASSAKGLELVETVVKKAASTRNEFMKLKAAKPTS